MTDKNSNDAVITHQQGSDAEIIKKFHHLLVERLLAYLEGKITLKRVFQLSETLYTMEVLKSSRVLQKALDLLHGMYVKLGNKDKLTPPEKADSISLLNMILNDIT